MTMLLISAACSSDDDSPAAEGGNVPGNSDSKNVECVINVKYDQNLNWTNIFPDQALTLSVWAFDENGTAVWSHRETDKAALT